MSGLDDPKAWVAKADEDLLNIENNLAASRVPWSTVCFHAHQVAEKMLKAYLVAEGRVPPKTHDLIALLELSRSLGSQLENLDADCELLLGFGSAARYPGEHLTPTEQQARKTIAAAKRVRERMLELLRDVSSG